MSGRGRGRGRGRGGAPLSQSKLMLQRSAMEAGLDEQHAIMDLTRPRLYADFIWHSSGDPRNSINNNNNDNPSSSTTATAHETTTTTPEGLQVTKRSASTRNLVSKQREFMERFAASAYFIRANQTSDIVKNYSYRSLEDEQKPSEPDAIVLEAMGKKLASDPRYVPLELGPARQALLLANKRKAAEAAEASKRKLARLQNKTANWDTLEQKERSRKDAGDDNPEQPQNPDEEEEEDEDGLAADDPLEEDGDDYMQDYYASEDDDGSDGGGGGDDGEAVF